jgi:integrase/recombinase XerD
VLVTVVTVASEIEGFKKSLQGRNLSPATVVMYLEGVRRFDMARPGVDVRAVSRADVDAYMAELRAAGRTPSTVNLWMRTLRHFYEYLMQAQRVLISPLEHWREKRHVSLPGRTLTEAETQKLLDTPNTSLPQGIRDRALLELLYAAGLRLKEVCGLAVYDLDLEGGLVRVRHGKGDKERLVPLTTSAQKWLGEYVRQLRPRVAKRGREGERALFLTRSGQPLRPGPVQQIVWKQGLAAGLPRVSCHAMRRTLATALLAGGADIVSVAEVLGHANVSTTERYTRVLAKDLRAVHKRTHPRR